MHGSMERSDYVSQQGRRPVRNTIVFDESSLMSHESVQVKVEPPQYAIQSTSFGMNHSLPLTPPVSAHCWQDHSISEAATCYNNSLSVPEYSEMSYQQYVDTPLITTALMPYPTFTTSFQAPALFYNSDSPCQTSPLDYGQIPSNSWPMTPQSHVGTPEGSQHFSASDKSWPSSALTSGVLQSQARTFVSSTDFLSSPMHSTAIERSPSHDIESISGYGSSQNESCYGSVSPRSSAAEFDPSRREHSADDTTQTQPPLDPNLRCPICGKIFTRRSNCREHFKRHNPENRKVHSCGECGKTFGRKTDLNRHYLTVSLSLNFMAGDPRKKLTNYLLIENS